MKIQPVPPDENQRLARLASLGLVYSPAEERFDRITRLTHRVIGVPVALITLVAEECNWFKSAQGTSVDQQPREMSFCSHAIMGNDIFTIPDTLLDPAFADNPQVKGEPFIRFYAGQPIMYQGSPMGALCINRLRAATIAVFGKGNPLHPREMRRKRTHPERIKPGADSVID
jgi:GAF domain-containing protein